MGEAATLEGNGVVGPGGRGGGLLNEGFVQFDGAATFLLNEVSDWGGEDEEGGTGPGLKRYFFLPLQGRRHPSHPSRSGKSS